MSASPQWKVYTSAGEYVASCKYIVDAAALVDAHGKGASIKRSHGRILWKEGVDGYAANSYDNVAQVVISKIGVRA